MPRTATPIQPLIYHGHQGAVTRLTWSPAGAHLASADQAGIIQVWEAATGLPLCTSSGHQGVPLSSLAWSPDGTRIASLGQDHVLQVWEASTGAVLRRRLISSDAGDALLTCCAVAWSPDGTTLATAFQHHLRLWEAQTGSLLRTDVQPTLLLALAWSPDGATLLTGALDGVVRVLEATTGQVLCTLRAGCSPLRAVAWSPDGQQCAAAEVYRACLVWDLAARTLVTRYPHDGPVHTLAWSPDGQHLASASDDQGVHVWDAQTGERRSVYRGHREVVYALAWSPDGSRVASASRDGTVQVWMPRDGLATQEWGRGNRLPVPLGVEREWVS